MRWAVRAGCGREAAGCVWGDGSASSMHTGKARLKACAGAGHAHGAHPEHVVHVRDHGRVEAAERLVEHCRALPSQREGVRCGARWRAGREADERGLVAAQAVCTGEGLTRGLEVRARAERTWNMRSMPVTLEVSKLLSGWLNFPARCQVEGRA